MRPTVNYIEGLNATNRPRSADAPAAMDERSLRQTDLQAGFGTTVRVWKALISPPGGRASLAPPFPFGCIGSFRGLFTLNKK